MMGVMSFCCRWLIGSFDQSSHVMTMLVLLFGLVWALILAHLNALGMRLVSIIWAHFYLAHYVE